MLFRSPASAPRQAANAAISGWLGNTPDSPAAGAVAPAPLTAASPRSLKDHTLDAATDIPIHVIHTPRNDQSEDTRISRDLDLRPARQSAASRRRGFFMR